MGAKEEITNTEAWQAVAKKIITIENDNVEVEYEV